MLLPFVVYNSDRLWQCAAWEQVGVVVDRDTLLEEVYKDRAVRRDMEGNQVVLVGSPVEAEDSQPAAAGAEHEVPCLVGASSRQSEEE